jgi:hypothetical protein
MDKLPLPAGDGFGDVTRLDVEDNPTSDPKLEDLVTDLADEPIDFHSVDGLLVYDNATFREYGDPAQRREYLLRTGQPLYIARHSGEVVRGPLGENK